jgi:hypothetical protein
VAGCGDPKTERVAVGESVIGIDPFNSYDRLYLDKSDDRDMPGMALGVHLSVVDDSELPGEVAPHRMVRVHVEDGKHQGKSGTLSRSNLIRKPR